MNTLTKRRPVRPSVNRALCIILGHNVVVRMNRSFTVVEVNCIRCKEHWPKQVLTHAIHRNRDNEEHMTCVMFSSCKPGDHSYSWPCEYESS